MSLTAGNLDVDSCMRYNIARHPQVERALKDEALVQNGLLYTMGNSLSSTCHATLVFWGQGSLGVPLELLAIAKPLPATEMSCIHATILVHSV